MIRWAPHVRRAATLGTLLSVAFGPMGAQQRDDRASTLAPAKLRPRWLLSVDASSAYESNVLFGAQDTPVADAYHRVAAVLTGGVANTRTRLDLDLRGDVVRFARLGALDRETYDVGATLFRRWTGRLATQVAARAVTSIAPIGLPTLSTTALLPLTISRTQSLVGALNARVRPRVELSAALDGSRVRFDDTTFAGGTTFGGVIALSAKPSMRSTVGAVLEGRQAAFDQTNVVTEALEGDFRRDLGPASLRLRAGATALQELVGAGESVLRPSGSLELLRARGSVAYSLRLSRAVTPAFGFGRALETDQFAMSLQRGRAKDGYVRLTGDASRSTDPTDPRVSLRFAALTGEWRHALGGGLSLATVGFARRRLDGGRITNTGGSLQLSYGGGR